MQKDFLYLYATGSSLPVIKNTKFAKNNVRLFCTHLSATILNGTDYPNIETNPKYSLDPNIINPNNKFDKDAMYQMTKDNRINCAELEKERIKASALIESFVDPLDPMMELPEWIAARTNNDFLQLIKIAEIASWGPDRDKIALQMFNRLRTFDAKSNESLNQINARFKNDLCEWRGTESVPPGPVAERALSAHYATNILGPAYEPTKPALYAALKTNMRIEDMIKLASETALLFNIDICKSPPDRQASVLVATRPQNSQRFDSKKKVIQTCGKCQKKGHPRGQCTEQDCNICTGYHAQFHTTATHRGPSRPTPQQNPPTPQTTTTPKAYTAQHKFKLNQFKFSRQTILREVSPPLTTCSMLGTSSLLGKTFNVGSFSSSSVPPPTSSAPPSNPSSSADRPCSPQGSNAAPAEKGTASVPALIRSGGGLGTTFKPHAESTTSSSWRANAAPAASPEGGENDFSSRALVLGGNNGSGCGGMSSFLGGGGGAATATNASSGFSTLILGRNNGGGAADQSKKKMRSGESNINNNNGVFLSSSSSSSSHHAASTYNENSSAVVPARPRYSNNHAPSLTDPFMALQHDIDEKNAKLRNAEIMIDEQRTVITRLQEEKRAAFEKAERFEAAVVSENEVGARLMASIKHKDGEIVSLMEKIAKLNQEQVKNMTETDNLIKSLANEKKQKTQMLRVVTKYLFSIHDELTHRTIAEEDILYRLENLKVESFIVAAPPLMQASNTNLPACNNNTAAGTLTQEQEEALSRAEEINYYMNEAIIIMESCDQCSNAWKFSLAANVDGNLKDGINA